MRLRRKVEQVTAQRPAWERPDTVADRPAVIHAVRAGDVASAVAGRYAAGLSALAIGAAGSSASAGWRSGTWRSPSRAWCRSPAATAG
jgi:hypothetical protein